MKLLSNIKIIKMKKVLCILLTVTTVLSCKKEKVEDDSNVVGKWNWVFYYLTYPNPNGTGPTKITPADAGFTESLEFTNEKNWFKTQDNIRIDSGTYTVEQKEYTNLSNTTYKYNQLTYYRNNSILGADYFKSKGDTLILNPSYAGYFLSQNVAFTGGVKYYKKK
jgi:hypothetical protein